MHKVIETHSQGGTKNPNHRCVLLCQHNDDGRVFLKKYPQILKKSKVWKSTLERFIDIERDCGSFELAQAIMKIILKESRGDFYVELIKSNIPRAIMDTNRTTRFSINKLLNIDHDDPLIDDLLQLHIDIIGLTRRRLFKLLGKGGVFVDVHTMAPYSPKIREGGPVRKKLTGRFVRRHIESYVNAQTNGKRRFLDLAIGYPGTPTADTVLLERLRTRLKEASIIFRENDPYPAVIHGMVGQYMTEYPGISVDVPKDFLTASRAESGNFDFLNPKIDEKKVLEIARPIALAILDRQLGMF